MNLESSKQREVSLEVFPVSCLERILGYGSTSKNPGRAQKMVLVEDRAESQGE